jgi:hypothetical protein
MSGGRIGATTTGRVVTSTVPELSIVVVETVVTDVVAGVGEMGTIANGSTRAQADALASPTTINPHQTPFFTWQPPQIGVS